MQASNPLLRSEALVDTQRSELMRLVSRLEGDVLELVVHSIEGLRGRLSRYAR